MAYQYGSQGMRVLPVFLLACFIIIGGCAHNEPSAPKTQQNYDWPAYANDSFSSKYAPLEQIDQDNVKQYISLAIGGSRDARRITLALP